jgi:hypothetical protein
MINKEHEIEAQLELKYKNKVISITTINRKGEIIDYVGKVERMSIDSATKRSILIIIHFTDTRIEMDLLEFHDTVKLLN